MVSLSKPHLPQPLDYLVSVVAMEGYTACQSINSATEVLHSKVLSQHFLHHLGAFL